MTPISLLRLCICLFWLFMASNIIAGYFFFPRLPQNMVDLFHHNPKHIYAVLSSSIALVVLMLASILLWCRLRMAKVIFILGATMLIASTLLLGHSAFDLRVALLDESATFMLGLLIGMLFCEPFNQLFSDPKKSSPTFNLAKISYLRIVCLLIVSSVSLMVLSILYFDPLLPKMVVDYIHANSLKPYPGVPKFITDPIIPIYLIALIALLFRSSYAKYIFLIDIIFCIVSEPPQPYVIGAITMLMDDIFVMLNGILFVMLLSRPLSQQLGISKRFNLFRMIILAFYSKSFYREVVDERKGLGLFYLFSIIALVTIIPTYHLAHSLPVREVFASPILIDQLPTITIHNKQVAIDKPVPYTIYDKDKNPLAIIDTSGKYTSLSSMDSLKLLITKDRVFTNTNDEVHQISLANLSGAKDIVISKDNIGIYLWIFELPMLIGFFVAQVIINFILSAIAVLIIALTPQLKNRLESLGFNYKTRTRLVVCAMSSAILICTALSTIIPVYGIVEIILMIAIALLHLWLVITRPLLEDITSNAEATI